MSVAAELGGWESFYLIVGTLRNPQFPDNDITRRFRLFSYWLLAPPDSVEIWWTDGLTGWHIHLTAHGDRLSGYATEISDVPAGTPRRANTVRALSVPCPDDST